MNDAEWEALRHDLRGSYEALLRTLSSLEAWGDDEIGDGMAIVVHTAYHLGAIRQGLKAVGSLASGT